jgi:hypothetical protein
MGNRSMLHCSNLKQRLIRLIDQEGDSSNPITCYFQLGTISGSNKARISVIAWYVSYFFYIAAGCLIAKIHQQRA